MYDYKFTELLRNEVSIAKGDALVSIAKEIIESLEKEGYTFFEFLEAIEQVFDERCDFKTCKIINKLIENYRKEK